MVSHLVLIREAMKKYQIARNDFEVNRKEAIFEFQLDEPEMDKLLIEEIEKVGDQQGHKTNAQCQMTYWQMWEYPGFERFAKMYLDACDAISRMQFNPTHNYKFLIKNLVEAYNIVSVFPKKYVAVDKNINIIKKSQKFFEPM